MFLPTKNLRQEESSLSGRFRRRPFSPGPGKIGCVEPSLNGSWLEHMSQLVSESRILGTSPQGDVLEISFRGTHERSHGGKMNEYIHEKLKEHAPAAIVLISSTTSTCGAMT